jgi:hypothetical protein
LTDELGIEILAQEPAEDHLHILFTATPTTKLKTYDTQNMIPSLKLENPKLKSGIFQSSSDGELYPMISGISSLGCMSITSISFTLRILMSRV